MKHLTTTTALALWLGFSACVIDANKACQSNDECNGNEICDDGQCVYPCQTNPCVANSECMVNHHVKECLCQPGFTGDPTMECAPLISCSTNEDCDAHMSCAYGTCVDPCLAIAGCGGNTNCNVIDHRMSCTCLEGYSGNPYDSCTKSSCTSDADCDSDRACSFDTCVDPCVNTPINCGKNAVCSPLNHRPSCTCIHGYFGDPMHECHSAEPGTGGKTPQTNKTTSEHNKYHAEISFKTNWQGALELCRNKGQRLASVMSEEDNQLILKEILKTKMRREHFWTAGTDQKKEDHWVWETTGLPFNFTNWQFGQPDNLFIVGGEDCMGYKEIISGYKWNDKRCTHEAYVICEEFNNNHIHNV